MAWSRVQSVAGAVTGAATLTVTYTANVASGNKLISAVAEDPSTTDPSSVQDAALNSETILGSVSDAISAVNVSLWAMDVPAGDAGTKPAIKVTFSGTQNITMLVQEVSGLLAGNTTAMLDGTAATSHGTTLTYTNPTYSSAATNEFLVSVYGDNGGPTTYAAANSYTLDPNGINNNTINDVVIAYKNSTNGAEAAAYTLSGTGTGWGSILVAFKLAASGGSPVLPLLIRQRRTYLPKKAHWARGAVYNLVPAQVPVPVWPKPVIAQHRLYLPAPKPRGRTFAPIPTQVAVSAPPRAPDAPTQRRALRGWLRVRGKYADPPWPQSQAPVNPAIVLNPSQRKTVRGWLRVKGRYVDPPWPQERPADTPQQRKAIRGWLRVKGRTAAPPVPPPVAVPNPAITFNPSQRRALRGWPQGRGRTVTPVPPQIPVPPRKPDDPTQRRSLRGWLRIRPKQWAPPWPQAAQPPVQDLVVQVSETLGRWSTAQTLDRWFSSPAIPRWATREAQSRWIITRPAGGLSMAQTISTASLEYVRVPVAVTKSGAAYNPTGDTVQMTFVSSARSPNSGDTWYAGSWETAGSTYYALCLVGPAGTVVLAAGTWYVWVKVTDAPEIPALPAGVIVVQ